MPIRVSNLAKNVRETTVAYEGETAAVSYKPGSVTPNMLDEMQAHKEDAGALVSLIRRCVAEWDVLQDDGKPLPTDAPAVGDLPVAFLNAVLTAVFEDMRPNPSTGGTSAAG
jgi:hypothetical protein